MTSVTEVEVVEAISPEHKNCWSGYHVQFRNPRNFETFAIDEQFNRWGDMVEFFKNQEKPYRLSQGSLKDLLYGTYKRKGMHSLSLNDLVCIQKITREKISKQRKTSDTKEEVDSGVSSGVIELESSSPVVPSPGAQVAPEPTPVISPSTIVDGRLSFNGRKEASVSLGCGMAPQKMVIRLKV